MNESKQNPALMQNVYARRRCAVRRSPRCRGAVVVLSLLGAFMIAGLIAYVFNTGRHAQLRQQTQHAADATAISGAGYIARSFNTVAMNNVEMSRLIAAVQMLDAVPMTVEYTLLDLQASLELVQEQQSAGTGSTTGDLALDEVAQKLIDQIRRLTDMDRFFNRGSYDVTEMTFYDSSFGRGELWKAMESLDAISTATMEQLHELATLAGHETGMRNLSGSERESVAELALPPNDVVIWNRYEFDDFLDPVVHGRLPRGSDDEEFRRGPYDTIFGWRVPVFGTDEDEDEDDTQQSTPPQPSTRRSSQRGNSPWSGSVDDGSRNRRSTSRRTVIGYKNSGPWWWMRSNLNDQVRDEEVLRKSRFNSYFNEISDTKLNYLWPGTRPSHEIIEPRWITDYDEAVSIDEAGTPEVIETQFIRIEMQQYSINGTPTGPEEMAEWIVYMRDGAHFSVPRATKIRDHVWEDDDAYVEWEVPRLTDEGRVVFDVHRIDYRWLFVWSGMNVGEEIEVRNPNNFAGRSELPAPIDFDHTVMPLPNTTDSEMPYSPFTYLAIAKQPNSAKLWGQLYNTQAFDGHVAISQVGVFNNHSWDLWTQMWHAQLEPVTPYEQWMQNLFATTPQEQEVLDYLRSLEPLAPVMLQH